MKGSIRVVLAPRRRAAHADGRLGAPDCLVEPVSDVDPEQAHQACHRHADHDRPEHQAEIDHLAVVVEPGGQLLRRHEADGQVVDRAADQEDDHGDGQVGGRVLGHPQQGDAHHADDRVHHAHLHELAPVEFLGHFSLSNSVVKKRITDGFVPPYSTIVRFAQKRPVIRVFT